MNELTWVSFGNFVGRLAVTAVTVVVVVYFASIAWRKGQETPT